MVPQGSSDQAAHTGEESSGKPDHRIVGEYLAELKAI